MTDGKTPKNNNAHTRFLHDHGLGPDRLGSLFARIDWRREDAESRARGALSLFITTIAELLRADARARRQSLTARLTTLTIRNDPAERPLLGLALPLLETGAPLHLTATQRRQLAQAAATLPVHARLLREGAVAAARLPELAAVDVETRMALLARQLRAAKTPSPAARLLKLAAQCEERSGVLRARARLAQQLLTGFAVPTTLDYTTFRALPTAMRRVLLFTPALCRYFLDAQAQAAARPPSPNFDPLYLEHALDELARGRLSHVVLDTLFLAADAPAYRARIVDALANGKGELSCDTDLRERLIAGASQPEICLLACAAAASPADVRRALARPVTLPMRGRLGEALRGFARIAWREVSPADLPATLRGDSAFIDEQLAARSSQLRTLLRGEPVRLPAGALFRQFTAWLQLAGGAHSDDSGVIPPELTSLLATEGHRLAADIDGHDLHALHAAGATGAHLARLLARRLRDYNPARWEHGFAGRLADAAPQLVRELLADADPAPTGDDHVPAEDTGTANDA